MQVTFHSKEKEREKKSKKERKEEKKREIIKLKPSICRSGRSNSLIKDKNFDYSMNSRNVWLR